MEHKIQVWAVLTAAATLVLGVGLVTGSWLFAIVGILLFASALTWIGIDWYRVSRRRWIDAAADAELDEQVYVSPRALANRNRD